MDPADSRPPVGADAKPLRCWPGDFRISAGRFASRSCIPVPIRLLPATGRVGAAMQRAWAAARHNRKCMNSDAKRSTSRCRGRSTMGKGSASLVERLHGYSEELQGKVWESIGAWAESAADDKKKAALRERIRLFAFTRRARSAGRKRRNAGPGACRHTTGWNRTIRLSGTPGCSAVLGSIYWITGTKRGKLTMRKRRRRFANAGPGR